MSFIASAIQFAPAFNRPEHNRHRLTLLVEEAAAKSAQIVVVPELAVHGYLRQDAQESWCLPGRAGFPLRFPADPASAAEPVPGPSTDHFSRLAARLGIYLTVPVLEVSAGRFFNSVCLASPEGRLLVHYRKRHPWPPLERYWAAPGDLGPAVLDTPLGRLGIAICYDIHHMLPEYKRLGVQTLLFPSSWIDLAPARAHFFERNLRGWALRHGMNMIVANWTTPGPAPFSGPGFSRVISGAGRVLAAAGRFSDCVVAAEVPRSDPA